MLMADVITSRVIINKAWWCFNKTLSQAMMLHKMWVNMLTERIEENEERVKDFTK